MYNKVQFTVKDLNTMYAAGILHTRESLGFGKNFKKAGVESPIPKEEEATPTKDKKSLVADSAALVALLEDLVSQTKGSSKSSGDVENSNASSSPKTNTANGNKEASTSSVAKTSPISTSGKASSGTPAETKDLSKIGGSIGGLFGGPVGTLLGLGLGKLVEGAQKDVNAEAALVQQAALDDLIGSIQNNENTLDSLLANLTTPAATSIDGSAGEDGLSDSESRSNSQGF